jgi:hypothetical protein
MKRRQFVFLSTGLSAALLAASRFATEPSGDSEVVLEAKRFDTPAWVGRVSATPMDSATPSSSAPDWQRADSRNFPPQIANPLAAEVAIQHDEPRRATQARPASTDSARREKQQLLEQVPRVEESAAASLLSAGRPASSPDSRIPLVASSSSRTQERRSSPLAADEGTSTVAETNVPALQPAVLMDPDPVIPWSELQAAEWLKLEQDFVDRIGGTDQDPSDPAYRRRWQSAQEISDAMFRAKFGTEAFLRHNIEAGRRLGSE